MPARTKKLRGSRTHGRGKKHGRGAGCRGGTGNAGLHKHKFKWMLIYDPDHFGAHGFVRHHDGEREVASINLEALEERIDAFVQAGYATPAGNAVEVDLGKAGFTKLLGGGRVGRPLRITVEKATPSAVAKVSAAGGEVRTSEAS